MTTAEVMSQLRSLAGEARRCVALEYLSKDPLLFLHPVGAGCEECDPARQTVGTAPFIKNTG